MNDKGCASTLDYLKHLRDRAKELKAKRVDVNISVEQVQELIDALEATA